MKHHSKCWQILLGIAIWLMVLPACIEQIDIPGLDNQFGQLVVEASFTNENRVQAVYLSRAASLAATNFPQETGAMVYIVDGQNNRIDFRESEPGIYTTLTNTQGKSGEIYTLHIVTTDGNTYESSSELMPKAPPVIKSTKTTEEVDIAGDFGPPGDTNITVEVLFDDPAREVNFYQWVWFSSDQNQFGIPDINWRTLVTNDVLFDGNEASVILNRVFTPNVDRYAKVYQTAINAAAYDFLIAVQNQVDNDLSAFSSPGPPIAGNIVNKNNSRDKVLGYFIVASVTAVTVKFDP